jgi:hypothetical protein
MVVSSGLYHLVSEIPLDVTGNHAPGNGFPAGIFGTYRHFDRAPNGDIYAFIKDVPEQSGEGHLWHWNNSLSKWSFVAVVAAEYRKTVYSPWLIVDNTGMVHLSWHWGNGFTSSANRHLGSYAMYDPATGKFYMADGSEYESMPINTSNADVWQPLEPGVSWDEPEIRDSRMCLDGFNRPVIEYRYVGRKSRIARWDGSKWVRIEHNYRPGNNNTGMLSVHGTNFYFYKDGNVHVSENWGITWNSSTIAPGLFANTVVKSGPDTDVILYYKDKDGPAKDIYVGYVTYEDSPSDTTLFHVQAKVIDQLSGEPLEGARLSIEGSDFYTGIDGTADLGEYLYGMYHISVTKESYQFMENPAVLIKSDTMVNFTLQPVFPDVHVRVFDKANGESIYRPNISYGGTTRVMSNDGEITLSAVPFGIFVFKVNHSSYFSFTDSIELTSDTLLNVYLTRKLANITFKVIDSTELPGAVNIIANGFTVQANTQGMAFFYDFPARNMVEYTIKKTGMEDINGTFYLEIDTLINISLFPVGMRDQRFTFKVNVFPNPATDVIYIDTGNLKLENVSVVITDITGKRLHQQNIHENPHEIHINTIPRGVYFVEIGFPQMKTVKKISITN